jgi:hypothetical protein
MKNSTYIKDNYKLSTIPRMKAIFGFKTLKSIDDSQEVSRALSSLRKTGHIQEVLFDRIESEFKTTDVQQFVNTF